MNYSWLNKNNSSKLIVFFSGWGMDENSAILEYGNFDFLVFYNYENAVLNSNIVEEIRKYKEVYIIAWSMGVIISTILISKLNNIKYKIAINGTLKIIDDRYGIPTKIFNATLNNLSETTIKSFFQNMGYADFKTPNRDFASQLNELKSIENFYKNNEFNGDFDRIIIGQRDIIVPFKNQKRAWENKNFTVLDCGHYIFNLFNTWDDIINVK